MSFCNSRKFSLNIDSLLFLTSSTPIGHYWNLSLYLHNIGVFASASCVPGHFLRTTFQFVNSLFRCILFTIYHVCFIMSITLFFLLVV